MFQYEMHRPKNLQKVGTLYLQNIGVILTKQSWEGRSIQGCQRTEGGDWICCAEVPSLGGRILKQTFPLLTSRRGTYTTNTHQQTLNLQLVVLSYTWYLQSLLAAYESLPVPVCMYWFRFCILWMLGWGKVGGPSDSAPFSSLGSIILGSPFQGAGTGVACSGSQVCDGYSGLGCAFGGGGWCVWSVVIHFYVSHVWVMVDYVMCAEWVICVCMYVCHFVILIYMRYGQWWCMWIMWGRCPELCWWCCRRWYRGIWCVVWQLEVLGLIKWVGLCLLWFVEDLCGDRVGSVEKSKILRCRLDMPRSCHIGQMWAPWACLSSLTPPPIFNLR